MNGPVFAIRDDLMAAAPAWAWRAGRRRLVRACSELVDTLAAAVDDAVNAEVVVADVAVQHERFADVAAAWRRGGAMIVSGDPWTPGDVGVAVSRQFSVGPQRSATQVVARPGAASWAAQVRAVRSVVGDRPWVWVDDDVVTGTTMHAVAAMVGCAPVGSVSLVDLVVGPAPVVDVVDARDFCVGAVHGGLVVGADRVRVPYHNPRVDLCARASLGVGHHERFRERMDAANRRFVSQVA